jgi:hypothetical protein
MQPFTNKQLAEAVCLARLLAGYDAVRIPEKRRGDWLWWRGELNDPRSTARDSACWALAFLSATKLHLHGMRSCLSVCTQGVALHGARSHKEQGVPRRLTTKQICGGKNTKFKIN